MKLIILGATGGTGLEMVKQALDRGHQVAALVRSPERLAEFGKRLTIIPGDPLSASQLQGTLENQDAVLSAFGPHVPISKLDHDLLQRFARTLTVAMRCTQVRRLVIVSTAFLFKDAVIPPAHLFGRLFFRSLVADAAAMEQIVEQSKLDWTIVRPPQLFDGPAKGKYRVRERHLPAFGFRISRADVADFALQTLGDPQSVGKILGVAN